MTPFVEKFLCLKYLSLICNQKLFWSDSDFTVFICRRMHLSVCTCLGWSREDRGVADVGACRWFVFFPGGPCGDRSYELFTPSYHRICLELLCHAGHTGPFRGSGGRAGIWKEIWMFLKCRQIRGKFRKIDVKWEDQMFAPNINQTTFYQSEHPDSGVLKQIQFHREQI